MSDLHAEGCMMVDGAEVPVMLPTHINLPAQDIVCGNVHDQDRIQLL